MTNYTCIGIGTTDENGIAHITHDCEGNPLSEPGYHGSGAGETLIIASLDKPVTVESILSNILNITDEDRYNLTLTADKSIIQTGEVATLSATLTNNHIAVVNKTVNFLKKEEVFRDGGVTGDSSAEYWAWNSTYISQSVGSTGTTVTNSDNFGRLYTLRKATSGTDFEVFSRLCSFEFDLVSVNGTVQIQEIMGTTQINYALTETGHYKIVNDDEYINIYCNNVLKDRLENTMTGLHQVRFSITGVGNFTYKNFKVLDDEIFDTATTDVNGVATVSYTGQGAGSLNITAECMNLSKTYNIIDGVFFDDGVTDPKTASWNNPSSYVSVNIDSTGTTLSNASGTRHYWANNYTKFTGSFAVEFDILQYTDNTNAIFRLYGTNSHAIVYKTIGCPQQCHLKIVYDGTKIKYQIDDGEVTDFTTVTDTGFYIGFRFVGESSIKYNNFIVYPI